MKFKYQCIRVQNDEYILIWLVIVNNKSKLQTYPISSQALFPNGYCSFSLSDFNIRFRKDQKTFNNKLLLTAYKPKGLGN